jgi:hypothetical protein
LKEQHWFMHKFRIINRTKIKTSKIRKMLSLFNPKNKYDLVYNIIVSNPYCNNGEADFWSKMIRVTLHSNKFPYEYQYVYKNRNLRKFPKYIYFNQEEELLNILSHEYRHFWQFHQKTYKKYYRYNGRNYLIKDSNGLLCSCYKDEYDAEMFAINILKKWRKL